jgi:hypothetical protein
MAESDSDHMPLVWEKAKAASTIVAALAIPIVIAYLGNSLSQAQKQEELAVRYVELAIGILRSEPTNDTRALRTWAVTVLGHYSQVPLSPEVQDELKYRAFQKDAQQVRSIVENVLRDIQPRASAPMKQQAGSESGK